MTAARTVLVTGATGTQGGAVARALLAREHRVRALTRKPDSAPAAELRAAGAEIVVGDFDDEASLRAAATGADCVFAMGTPLEIGPDGETRQAISVITAAVAADVSHIVYSSAAGADRDTGIGWFESKRLVERHLAGVRTRWTVVAPTVFMDVVRAPHVVEALRWGRLSMALPPTRRLQYIDVADIGGFVAEVVEHPSEFAGRRIDIASDQLDGTVLAALLAEAGKRPITYAEMSIGQLCDYAGPELGAMFSWFDAVGFDVDIPRLRAAHPGVGWHSFASWAAGQDWSLLDS